MVQKGNKGQKAEITLSQKGVEQHLNNKQQEEQQKLLKANPDYKQELENIIADDKIKQKEEKKIQKTQDVSFSLSEEDFLQTVEINKKNTTQNQGENMINNIAKDGVEKTEKELNKINTIKHVA